MKGIAKEIEESVREIYSGENAELVLLALSEMSDPNLTPEFAELRARVQLATLVLAKGDMNALLAQVDASRIDWRDTLIAAEMGSLETWRSVAVAAGLRVPGGGAA